MSGLLVDMRVQRAACLAVVGFALTVARRWRNSESDAGYGIAGWTLAGVILILLGGR